MGELEKVEEALRADLEGQGASMGNLECQGALLGEMKGQGALVELELEGTYGRAGGPGSPYGRSSVKRKPLKRLLSMEDL